MASWRTFISKSNLPHIILEELTGDSHRGGGDSIFNHGDPVNSSEEMELFLGDKSLGVIKPFTLKGRKDSFAHEETVEYEIVLTVSKEDHDAIGEAMKNLKPESNEQSSN